LCVCVTAPQTFKGTQDVRIATGLSTLLKLEISSKNLPKGDTIAGQHAAVVEKLLTNKLA